MVDFRGATALAETRAVTIHVSDRVYAGLIERGRRAGYTPGLFAKLLFEAAWAARVGQETADPVLAACVRKSLDRSAATAVALPPPAPTIETRVVHEAVAVPVPVLVPVPIAVPMAASPLAVHISTSQPIRSEDAEHLAALIAAGAERLRAEAAKAPEPVPMQGWSVSQATVARLVCREEGLSSAEAKATLAPAYASSGSLKVLMSVVRNKLAAQDIFIETVPTWGWRVVAASRAAAEAFLERAI